MQTAQNFQLGGILRIQLTWCQAEGAKKDRLAFTEKVALSEIGLPVAEAKAKINISGSGTARRWGGGN